MAGSLTRGDPRQGEAVGKPHEAQRVQNISLSRNPIFCRVGRIQGLELFRNQLAGIVANSCSKNNFKILVTFYRGVL